MTSLPRALPLRPHTHRAPLPRAQQPETVTINPLQTLAVSLQICMCTCVHARTCICVCHAHTYSPRRGGGGHPSSLGPPVVPAEGGPKILKLKSYWH